MREFNREMGKLIDPHLINCSFSSNIINTQIMQCIFFATYLLPISTSYYGKCRNLREKMREVVERKGEVAEGEEELSSCCV